MEQHRIDLGPLVAQIVTDADFEARSRHRAVRIQDMQAGTAYGNPDLLRSAIENVIRNAVRHTAEQTEVLVTFQLRNSVDESVAVIKVIDHGPGVPEEKMADISGPSFV